MNLSSWVGKAAEANPLAFTTPIELDDGPTGRRSYRVLAFGSMLVVAGIVWATLTPIRELAVAGGQIMPEGQIRVLQHLEGGVVAEILVRPGMSVKAGDPLVKLAPAAVVADYGQLRSRIFDLGLQRARLKALLDGKPFATAAADAGSVLDAERSVFAARQVKAEADRLLYTSKLQQQREEVLALETEVAGLQGLVRVQQEQVEIRGKLLPKGLTSKRDYLEAEAAFQQAQIQAASAAGRLAKAREAVAEAEHMLAGAEAETRRIWSEELAKVESELAEMASAIEKQADRAARLVVRSPVDGEVLELMPTSVGDVIPAGQPIGKVVPSGTTLLAEVQIKPEDIGHVLVGDEAEIRVTTFDPNVYGRLTGRVTDISQSTLQTPDGVLYYRAKLSLDADVLGDSAHPRPLKAGMVVQAQIVTGEKSLMRYLLKPIYRTFGLAFSER
ncbi:HlyD family type I secretion periplasmic adaptor subunit [Chthonobacter albigriseus]|uniref:HlyD family type I secretion periplasmic adaptor subunit n=1 Tax=Chthonobacter albigriseus TaxID=1683161 RepID=UPI0015EE6715|nr:HlyD family type I secretion periplasmic adaptor subunit [Chthonobacter albigriseus]